MFYVGIDISKFKHDCVIIDDNSKVITPTFTFSNNAFGFHLLLNALSQFEKESLKIGFEATGHYVYDDNGGPIHARHSLVLRQKRYSIIEILYMFFPK